MVSAALLEPGEKLQVHCAGGRTMTLKWADIEARYLGERGRRGSLLPKNYRRVERLEAEVKPVKTDSE